MPIQASHEILPAFGTKTGVVLPPQTREVFGRLTLVLDVDETLIHSTFVNPEDSRGDLEQNESSFSFDNVDGKRLVVTKRPHLDEFLREAAKVFEVIAFTAGTQSYADRLLDVLDPNNEIFAHRLYRQHCYGKGDSLVKDLRILNRSMKRIVLVDNNHTSFLPNMNN